MNEGVRNLLLVDDERPILRSLQRSFADENYEIHLAGSGAEALECMANEKIDMIISDMRMPEMDGHQLLRQVRDLYPQTLRVILSGYSDENVIFRSLLDGSARLYLLKPWENERLLQVVANMLKMQDLFREKRIMDAVSNVESLPVMSRIYSEVNRMIDDNAEIKDIADEIEMDPAMAARVLSLANSAFAGVNTGSVKQAIVYMGLTVVKELLLSISVMETALESDRRLFLRHATYSNRLTEAIFRRKLNKKLPDTVACAGLLHNIGTLFLKKNFAKSHEAVQRRVNTGKGLHISLVERELIGFSHEEIGGYLLDWWGLPFPMVEAAMHHHTPSQATDINRDVICAVHIADCLAWELADRKPEQEVDEWALKQLDITLTECHEIVKDLA
ncbi:MAG TPA: HDOD domain-containing protein [Patescibacteria group bacterium]|nr:HDOD domain-containing protein [Patescibacteria group bacterium]